MKRLLRAPHVLSIIDSRMCLSALEKKYKYSRGISSSLSHFLAGKDRLLCQMNLNYSNKLTSCHLSKGLVSPHPHPHPLHDFPETVFLGR
jgi:hypothetical protein